MKRTKIIDALLSRNFGNSINVKGWVRSHRSSKVVDFIALNDGSTINNIQIVVDPKIIDNEQLKCITTGSCISVVGTLVESQGKGQTCEIQCKDIEIYGLCPNDYPMQKKRDKVLSICANMDIYVCVLIPLAQYLEYAIIWL